MTGAPKEACLRALVSCSNNAEAAAEQPGPALALADAGDILSRRDDPPESTIGGDTTCVICFANPKTHLAVPCGHICACGPCADLMDKCPYCREPAQMWIRHRMV